MALKPHQKVVHDDINFTCTSLGVQGQVVSYTTAGNVAVSNDLGDKVAGMLMQDVVNRAHPSNVVPLGEFTGTSDLPRNFNKNETHISGMVRLLKIGEITTNQVSGTFSVGDICYEQAGGVLAPTDTGGEVLGHALSATDADGFVKVFLNVN